MRSGALEALVESLRCLPGVGPKSARRMAFHLLQYKPEEARCLAQALDQALTVLRHCRLCNTFCEDEVCRHCDSAKRDRSLLCVVEMPVDLNTLEQTHAYQGMYYVLMGHLSPLDDIGPKELHLERLLKRATDGLVKEVILATNFTNEGEATAFYLGEILRARGLKVSRMARGMPVGGEIEYTDAGTVAQALLDRRPL